MSQLVSRPKNKNKSSGLHLALKRIFARADIVRQQRRYWGQRNLKHRLTSKRKMSAFEYFGGPVLKKKKQQTKIHRFLKGNPLLRPYRVLQVEQNEKIIITIIQFSISGHSCVNVSSPQTAGPRHFSRNPLMYLILGHTRPWKSGRVHFF